MSEEAIKLANKLLKSDADYLDHVTALCYIGNELYEQCWESEYRIFALLSSELDHLPLSHVRAKCSAEFLAKSDKELAEYIEYYKTDVISACNKIVK
ncbi:MULTISPECIES: hypothetical protein [unclassified Colwellia]|uniref:hypothetical protein n=1 Tax=unclassified Colwellia TaxID=196834 RepID=UPI0015F607D5|nr:MULTISPECIES: hypothetical protein [unclassified Colwellia]MBA6254432.1 hypothetical protein [Colwellia sp. MB3u-28]MBA6259324.1 hypothetical protein [Colwellia sp. MB3u-41]